MSRANSLRFLSHIRFRSVHNIYPVRPSLLLFALSLSFFAQSTTTAMAPIILKRSRQDELLRVKTGLLATSPAACPIILARFHSRTPATSSSPKLDIVYHPDPSTFNSNFQSSLYIPGSNSAAKWRHPSTRPRRIAKKRNKARAVKATARLNRRKHPCK